MNRISWLACLIILAALAAPVAQGVQYDYSTKCYYIGAKLSFSTTFPLTEMTSGCGGSPAVLEYMDQNFKQIYIIVWGPGNLFTPAEWKREITIFLGQHGMGESAATSTSWSTQSLGSNLGNGRAIVGRGGGWTAAGITYGSKMVSNIEIMSQNNDRYKEIISNLRITPI